MLLCIFSWNVPNGRAAIKEIDDVEVPGSVKHRTGSNVSMKVILALKTKKDLGGNVLWLTKLSNS